jgi:hypothetical protein
MEHGTFQRLTLDFDLDAFPCKQLYLCDNGELWWDLDFLHVDLLQHGVVDQKFKFVSQFRGLGDATALLAGCVFLHTASLATPACNLCANVCTSLALLFFFWQSIDSSRSGSLVKRYRHYLVHIACRCCDVIAAGSSEDVAVSDNCHLTIRRSRQVSGFVRLLQSTHATIAKHWKNTWAAMRDLGLLEDDFDAESHCFTDILVFVAMLRNIRRQQKKTVLGPLALKLLGDIRDALLQWLASNMDKHVMGLYAMNRDDMHKPPPALKRPGGHGKRQYVRMSSDAVWNLLEKARHTGSSLQTAIALKSDETVAGCHPSQCMPWIRKLQRLYADRAHLGFKNVNHYNIVADAGTHSCHETFVSLAYSWENDLAAAPYLQLLCM